jgi:hypothetical protein
MRNAMTILGAAEMLDNRQTRQIQNRIARLTLDLDEQHVEGEKRLSSIDAPKQGEQGIVTPYGYKSATAVQNALKDIPRALAEVNAYNMNYWAGIAEKERAATATFAGHIAQTEQEIGTQMFRGVYPGQNIPGMDNLTPVGGVAPSNQNVLPSPQGGSPFGQPVTPPAGAPPAPLSDSQKVADIAARYAAPGGMVPGQTNVLARPAGQIVIDQGGNKGMTTVQELQSTPEGKRLLAGMNMGAGQVVPQPSPIAQPTVPPGGTSGQPMFRSTQVQNRMNEIISSDMPSAEKRKAMEALVPLVGGNTRLLTAIRTEAALLTGDDKEPPGTETNYRQGLEAQLAQAHPDWPKSRVRFDAARQVRTENEAKEVRVAGTKAAAAQDQKNKDIDIPAIAQSVAEGHDARIAVKGSMGNPVASKVQSEVLKKWPKFDFTMSDANYKWRQSATNQRTINFAGGALPRLTRLDEQLSATPNVDLNAVNRIMRFVSVETGKPAYTNFESNRNAIVQEINTALSGSSATSDVRVKIELDNLKSARSPEQIKGAISNLREALIARLDVDLSPIYPIEVVRGEKTMQQYKDDMFKKYRGNYKADRPSSSAPPAGYKDSGKTSGGKAVWLSPDGKQAWIAE